MAAPDYTTIFAQPEDTTPGFGDYFLSDMDAGGGNRSNFKVTRGSILGSFLTNVAQLSSPGEDKILYFNNSTGELEFLAVGTNLSITSNTLDASGGGGGGGGISTLNTLTSSTQTFATGTSGTNFNISSTSSTHTFNIPTASGSNRGLLSTTDWTTFNSKIGGSVTNNVIPRMSGGALADSSIVYDGTDLAFSSNLRNSGATADAKYVFQLNKTAWSLSGTSFLGLWQATSASDQSLYGLGCYITKLSGNTKSAWAGEFSLTNQGNQAQASGGLGVYHTNQGTTSGGVLYGQNLIMANSGASATFGTDFYGLSVAATNASSGTGTTATVARFIYQNFSGGGTITNARGISISHWNNNVGTTENSYAIYIDSTVDIGTVSKYAFYSLSASPSLFSGTVTVPDDAYNATSWNGNNTIPTKNAVRDQFESLSSVYQPLDGDLTALAALTGTNDIYYRSASNTWTAVTIGSGLTFTSGTLSASGGGGGGASTALDNLASVAINTSLISDTDNTDDLGTASLRWKDGHAVKWIAPTFQAPGALTINAQGANTLFSGDLAGGTYSTLYGFQGSTITLQGKVQAKSGFGTLSGNSRLETLAASDSEVAFIANSAASPTVPIVRLQNNSTNGWEFWGDYWQVQKEATANPTSSQLTAGDHFSVYRKADKLVIAYNNSGTINYLTIPLDGSTTSWTNGSSAP